MSAYENFVAQVALHSQPDDPFPAWDTDITGYVDGALSGGHGRPSELQSVEAGTLSMVLNNADHRFTFGNTSSPYYPYWKQARQIRVVETIGYRSFPLFRGYLELPDITDWAESGDQLVAVTAVDRLTRLDRGRKFISTLAEHIRYHAGSALKAYWTLAEPSYPFPNQVTANAVPMSPQLLTSTVPATSGTATVSPSGGIRVPADDVTRAGLTCAVSATNTSVMSYALRASYPSTAPLQIATGQVFIVVAWVTMDLARDESLSPLIVTTDDGPISLDRRNSGDGTAPSAWRLTKPVGTLTGSVNSGRSTVSGVTLPIAMRIGITPNIIELWVGTDVFTGTLSGSLSSLSITDVQVAGTAFEGSVGHVQVYTGAATDWTNADFLAQRTMGYTGLAGQTTGERIVTLAGYAGIPSAELSIDRGTTFMSVASLAGKSALGAMQMAETTEQGILLANGGGQFVFQDRIRRYNI